jgi:hypothetical protein
LTDAKPSKAEEEEAEVMRRPRRHVAKRPDPRHRRRYSDKDERRRRRHRHRPSVVPVTVVAPAAADDGYWLAGWVGWVVRPIVHYAAYWMIFSLYCWVIVALYRGISSQTPLHEIFGKRLERN